MNYVMAATIGLALPSGAARAQTLSEAQSTYRAIFNQAAAVHVDLGGGPVAGPPGGDDEPPAPPPRQVEQPSLTLDQASARLARNRDGAYTGTFSQQQRIEAINSLRLMLANRDTNPQTRQAAVAALVGLIPGLESGDMPPRIAAALWEAAPSELETHRKAILGALAADPVQPAVVATYAMIAAIQRDFSLDPLIAAIPRIASNSNVPTAIGTLNYVTSMLREREIPRDRYYLQTAATLGRLWAGANETFREIIRSTATEFSAAGTPAPPEAERRAFMDAFEAATLPRD